MIGINERMEVGKLIIFFIDVDIWFKCCGCFFEFFSVIDVDIIVYVGVWEVERVVGNVNVVYVFVVEIFGLVVCFVGFVNCVDREEEGDVGVMMLVFWK